LSALRAAPNAKKRDEIGTDRLFVVIKSGAIVRRDGPPRDCTNGTENDATTAGGWVMSAPDVPNPDGPEQLPAEPPSAESPSVAVSPAEASPVEPPQPAPPLVVTEPRKPAGKGFLNWLLVRNELAQARENAQRFTAQQREQLRRAKLAFELGDLALSPGNAVRSGSTAPLAANLFRQSLYWALLCQRPDNAPASPEALWAGAGDASLAAAAPSEAERAQLASVMRSTFVELAEGTPEAQRATAGQLRTAANRLVTSSQRVLWQLEWTKLKRLARLLLLVVVCLIPVAAVVVLWPPKPDLAKGKPWHTSSIGIECHPEKSDCGGVTTDILFHTKLESNPWFEYDFGAPLAFSSLTIRNRSDFGPERAVPLVVEVSNDDKKFQEIARRTETFSTWKPSFPTQHARYLRLRVNRESMLHLEAVMVHP
jgi:hypothetical protein